VLPRVLIVSSCPGFGAPTSGLETGGLPISHALRELLLELFKNFAARSQTPPFDLDTWHIPYQSRDYDVDLFANIEFPGRYDVVISHIVLDSGARVTDPFFEMLAARTLQPRGQLWNPVKCIRKTTLHRKMGMSGSAVDPMPCIIKLDRNYNNQATVVLCRSDEELATWRRRTPEARQADYIREPLYLDHRQSEGGLYRLERWIMTFGSLTVECRFSDQVFVKALTAVRYSTRDRRCLEADLRLLSESGFEWRNQGIDCAYDEDDEAWDARYRLMTTVCQEFALHLGELDVIRTGKHEFRVLDLTSTAGRRMKSGYIRQVVLAKLVEAVRLSVS